MKFKKIYIEITNVCNLQCSFCSETDRTKQFMTTEQFEYIIQQIKPYTRHVYLHVLGEPLLHPQINRFLSICHKNNVKVNITTNGTLISQIDDKLNNPALRQINFSLHSENNTENYLDNILQFAITHYEQTYMNLRFWNLDKKDTQTADFLEKIQSFFGLAYSLTNQEVSSTGFRLHKNIFLQQNVQFTWPKLNNPEVFYKGKCYALKDQVAILVDGTVVPCCLDSAGTLALGNIFTKNFDDILTSERAVNIKNGFQNSTPVEPFCKTCGFAKRLNSKHI